MTTKRAIIIGASSGIGREVARLLLREGYDIGIAARRENQLIAFKEEFSQSGRVEIMPIDVTADNAAERLEALIEKLGGMDLYFHAAGIGKQNRELEPDTELQTVQTNALGFTRMIGAAYRYFAKQGTGHVAAITSIAGTKGLGPAPAYSATKAMQATYLEALEQQARNRKLNIHFTDIRPGFVDTDLLSGDFRYPMMLKPEKVARQIVRAIKHRRHVCIIDWKYRLLTMAWRCIPRCIWRNIKL
ncbi:SDR family NAD(P)-dependent oxidoreductase [Pseudoprevotella muciniphila]|uniref:SDR family NAD(P)-dependent oxidoreductase n=1 Tax=Pseudoprevotella muciniphila TaxID=2133944 RepID=A0A5P8E6N7_9BACT|nr:SDR family NAD(P)-dependent oxidoreductase [Pseudoprevotella muciniphila]QFQ12641.1 SDR family NAD(P)-dependent oxidoreductase [Pseudoprevotella muciniphila]